MHLKPPLPPMEARLVDKIPAGGGWQYEPKWDGFRCIAFRDRQRTYLQSKAGQPLARYFPDIADALASLPQQEFVMDGELVVPVRSALSFNDLQLRLHPAASRVQKLAKANPALYIVFDLLAEDGEVYLQRSLSERRQFLEEFVRSNFRSHKNLRLSPVTTDYGTARKWLEKAGGDLDGVLAKRLDATYAAGERTAMVKVKQIRTADCVVGGFRYARGTRLIGSLLLGLYAEDGLLHHVGFTSAFKVSERRALTRKFEALKKPPGFTGNAPGGPSRWSTDRTGEWEPVAPEAVLEIAYDHFTGGRFRHGTKLIRWRPDKKPRQCTMDQVEHREGKSLALV
jgi:ATP-dependent DNA ligase